MTVALRGFATWVVPDAWQGPISELAYRRTRRKYLRRLARNKALKGRHRHGSRCFVIGNGPSLNQQDLSRLSNEVTIVANSFFQHEQIGTIRPKYCCVGDPDFIADQPHSIAWLRDLESKPPDTTLFFRPWAPEVF